MSINPALRLRTRRIVPACIFLLMLALSSFGVRAETLTGRWIARQAQPDGAHTTTTIVLEKNGARLTGKVEVAWADLAIQNARIDGRRFSFQIPMGEAHWRYEGSLTHGRLHLTLFDPNAPPRSMTAIRAATNASALPARIPPPPLRELPPNGLALTPPMGWNSWNHFQGHIDDRTVRQIADAMVASGMRDAGYVYVTIDDTWEGGRDSQGNLIPNNKFPDMRALADYVHARGLKLGIYSSPGPTTCAGYEGSYGHEQQDARTFAAWGIDYLKYDWCSAFRIYSDAEMRAVYQLMGEALQATGRPIAYSFSQGGKNDVWTWGRLAGGNLWRTTDDIDDSYRRMAQIGFSQNELSQWSGKGGWNDPDMLEIGNGGMSADEYRAHMSLWALLAAPLIAGNDLRSMDETTRTMLTNAELIAIDRDPLGKQGSRLFAEDEIEAWGKPMADGSFAIGIFNRREQATAVTIPWKKLGIEQPSSVRDVWSHSQLAPDGGGISLQVPPHGAVLLRLH